MHFLSDTNKNDVSVICIQFYNLEDILMRKNKLFLTFTILLIALMIFSSCSNNNNLAGRDEKINIVCTTFPQYDWVREIIGEKIDDFNLTLLTNKGTDLHSYQPTAEDIAKISNSDLFIYVGGESDTWVDGALAGAINKNMKVINLVDALGDLVKAEEMVEGMQETEHDHDHDHSHDHEIEEEDIEDRSLMEFSGDWKSLYPLLLNGNLDEFLEHKAEEDGDDTTSKETYLERYKSSWACDVDYISIEGDTITFTYSDGTSHKTTYAYAGYNIIRDEDGEISNIRYQFKTEDESVAKYIQFNDHGYKPGEVEHFHIYFGNEDFDALTNSKTNPFFVPSNYTTEEILEDLMGHGHSHDHDHEAHSDEHVWLSLKNAKLIVKEVKDAIEELDNNNSETYTKNYTEYTKKLTELDTEYQKAVDSAKIKTVLFADRFPFRYMVDDYGLSYHAAFLGCSAETEASFETIVFLSNKLEELKLNTVLVIENSNNKLADTVISNTSVKNQKILVMDSMQSVTESMMKGGYTYLSAMRSNLEVLKEALN